MPAIAWCNKGSATSNRTPAFLLHSLRHLAWHHAFHLKVLSMPIISNAIADFCSCSFHLLDTEFLSPMNHMFSLQRSWRLLHPPSMMLSALTSALSCILPWESLPLGPNNPPSYGNTGVPSASPSIKTPHTRTSSHNCHHHWTPLWYPLF